ncbi:hypothetical protein SLEP1_g25630 [Rubroshorea leprosula]|uniref:Uncharacterized protein n=1 Tax=Rubroshorea leprosula TaxID=152421 RepID=A0AAV5JJE4_9ROSI|nr:hypothetical protein SLEP1_g25630 [Rubroshorea leprosula]
MGKLTLSQSGTLSTVSSSLGCILLLSDTWALVDAPVEAAFIVGQSVRSP